MKNNGNIQNSIEEMDWLAKPWGEHVCAWEKPLVDYLVSNIFGFHALQIGAPHSPYLSTSRIQHQWIAHHTIGHHSSDPIAVVYDFKEMPFDTHSIDLVILPHVLECSPHPHDILREVERILVPEGQVIICGLNKLSLWGAKQALGTFFSDPSLPPAKQLISFSRMKDWLQLLNIDILSAYKGCYMFPFMGTTWCHRYPFMKQWGSQWWSPFGVAYIIHGVKRIKNIPLVGPIWQGRRRRLIRPLPVFQGKS